MSYADFTGVREQIIANALVLFREEVDAFQQHHLNTSRSYAPATDAFNIIIKTVRCPRIKGLMTGYEAVLVGASLPTTQNPPETVAPASSRKPKERSPAPSTGNTPVSTGSAPMSISSGRIPTPEIPTAELTQLSTSLSGEGPKILLRGAVANCAYEGPEGAIQALANLLNETSDRVSDLLLMFNC